MVYALISDIHSNVEALEAVLEDARAEGALSYLCIGDIVGYGAQPHVCIEKLKSLKCIAIAGNHDYAVCGKTDTKYFNTYARQAVQWTAQQLEKVDLDFLSNLPLSYRHENFTLIHGSLDHPELWEYILSEDDALRSFELLKDDILFIGHSHVPFVFKCQGGVVTGMDPQDFVMEIGVKYIVNIGSVGQPRDLDNRASYCMYDSTQKKIRFRRIPYDFRITQNKILDAELPEILARRLELGR